MSYAILDDLNHALRRLWGKPAFAIAVVLTLAIWPIAEPRSA